ncbi:MAG: glycosyltransferase family 4 protein [Candidatus Zixiibacteriota bacterium]|nr:MAG: glycosyltransferase family 4 protein [candidate division Zixibacteria bacterium]
MKKILMFASEFSPTIGGIATYTVQLSLAAHEIGYDITVIAPEFGESLYKSDKDKYPFEVIRYNSTGYSARDLPSMIWRAWRITRSSKFDIIHASDWPDLATLGLLNKFKRVPFVSTNHGNEILRALAYNYLKRRIQQNLFKTPRYIFANSNYTRSLMLKYFPDYPQRNVIVTYFGVDPRRFGNDNINRDIRKIYSIPRDHIILLTVSRLDKTKGHKTILKALTVLPEELKNKITYLIVGKLPTGGTTSKSYVTDIHQLAGNSGVNVVFAGAINYNDLKSYYSCANIFCMPSDPHPTIVESFGLVYLEAAAQGVPSIASRIGGIPEVVLHEKTGLLIEPADVSGMVQALTRLLKDMPYRERLGRAALNYAGTFTWKRCAEQTYDL